MDANPLNWTAAPFLTLYLGLAVFIFAVGFLLRSNLGAGAERFPKLNELEWAWLAGGASRVGDVALLRLLSQGGARIDAKTLKITVQNSESLSAFVAAGRELRFDGDMSRRDFQEAVAPLVRRVRSRLEKVGYVPGDSEIGAFRRATLPFVGALVAFGFAKGVIGSERGHDVGFLTILVVLSGCAGFLLAARPRSTRAGRKALAAHRAANARLARAPLGHELPLAVALTGAAVLAGTEFAPVYAASRAGGDSGGGGCGGGGCGGGGCGGCS